MENLEIMSFENEQFGKIRTVRIDGEPWLAGKDVAQILGYANTKDAISTHVDKEDKRLIQRSEITTLENHFPNEVNLFEFVTGEIPNRGLTFINESGIYSLILSSKLPTAKQFKHWVTSEILPSIRKHGAYMTQATIDSIITDPANFLKLVGALAEEKQKNSDLQNALTVAEANNLELQTANKALAIQVNTWDYRRVTVALIRAYGTACYGGSSVAWAWCELYRRLQAKASISLKMRRGHSKTRTRALIDYIRKDEWPTVVQIAAAMCDEINLNIGMIIGRENESRLRAESA